MITIPRLFVIATLFLSIFDHADLSLRQKARAPPELFAIVFIGPTRDCAKSLRGLGDLTQQAAFPRSGKFG
jgi:hypothetical protein